ncbi:HAD family hydrolase [Stackebrandtia nassauensis]|uniref:HAD-superfamily hydrolase, subfamily IA, variant 1 n=1 Tax=Stackebrandtia nassauensis (strain DSM 44728 / CIP 108903 / NRRL B-16338 / NBRC 102104 / LLR-40K-21) TaxID=446470 RepID=D3PXE7_STANL|nr:HAD family hydrolase [Stackebrandtia nassauensis]ADD41410.1 HAD-superfamily hydrolase, subfamily IA, variant 1 [Stackebrandtia nassauensis DSM 44728]
MAITHVVWDWNGTLFDDARALIDTTIEVFAELGLPAVTVERYQAVHTQPIDEFYRRLLGGLVDGELLRRIHARFEVAYARRRPGLALTADTVAALESVEASGLSQSVLSMHPHDRLTALVERFGIAGRFVRVDGQRGADAGFKAAHLAGHLERLGLSGERVLVVGDSVDDAAASEDVGARCVLYRSGLHSVEALRRADVPIADTLREALTLGLRKAGAV